MNSLCLQLWVVLYSWNSRSWCSLPTPTDAKLVLSYLPCQIHLLTLSFNIFVVFLFVLLLLFFPFSFVVFFARSTFSLSLSTSLPFFLVLFCCVFLPYPLPHSLVQHFCCVFVCFVVFFSFFLCCCFPPDPPPHSLFQHICLQFCLFSFSDLCWQ